MAEEKLVGPAPPTPAKKGLFASKAAAPAPDISGLIDQVNAVSARVRIGEERYGDLRKKMLVVEQNMLTNHKKAMTEIKALQSDLLELKRTLQTVEDRIITIIKEIRLTARKEDIDVLRRYMDLWDPVKFITHQQVEKIIDEKLGKHEEEKPPSYDSPS